MGLRLKLVKCHRGDDAWRITAGTGQSRRIRSGALKGCWRRTVGDNLRSVYLVHKDYVLEFVIVIRVTF